MTFPTKRFLVRKPLRIRLDEIDGLLEFMIGLLGYLVLLASKKHDAIQRQIKSYKSKKWYHKCFF